MKSDFAFALNVTKREKKLKFYQNYVTCNELILNVESMSVLAKKMQGET
jgi:hypothetical protein